jgi:hypothetical protein
MKGIQSFLNESMMTWLGITTDVSKWLMKGSSIKDAKDIIGSIELGFEKAINDMEKESGDKKVIEKYTLVKDALLNIMKDMK